MTHPFHPLFGRQLVCVERRYNRYGMRLLLQVDEGTVHSVPPQWTDLASPDPEIVIGGHRALFRVADLMELAQMVEQLAAAQASTEMCKANFAANVNRNPPQRRLETTGRGIFRRAQVVTRWSPSLRR